MSFKLYLDEDVHENVGHVLRTLGYDAVTTREVGRKGTLDQEQLTYACKEQRALVTFNIRDYQIWHIRYMNEGKQHYGIIVSPQLPFRKVLQGLRNLLELAEPEDMINNLEFLQTG